MNKTRLSNVLAACCLVALCFTYHDRQVKADEGQDLRPKLLGAWGFVGPLESDGGPQQGYLKFWGLHHWSTTRTNPETGEILYHHGGTYTLDDDEYTETVRFATGASANQAGSSFKFTIKLEGDTYIQTGVDNPYNEKWVRLKALASEDEHDRQFKGWGTVVDPDSDCTIQQNDGNLTFTVPGTPHNLNASISGLNAPRVLKRVTGDFAIQAKVTGEFQPDPESTVTPRGFAFNGAGLLIWQDADHFIRLERNVWIAGGQRVCYPPLLEQVQDGRVQPTNPPGTLFESFFRGDSTWFRLERKDDDVSASYSHDGKEWTLFKTIAVSMNETVSVGVAAINTSKKPFEVMFGDLQVSGREAD